jgi:hypothetical protein
VCATPQGDVGSLLVLRDVVRVKLACQASQDVVASARSFKRASPAFPPNAVTLVPHVCFSAATRGAGRELTCYDDAIRFSAFSTLMANNEPDKGSQSPGYVLFQVNTTRVCQNFITQQCLQDHNDDEELCMAMLIAAARRGGGGAAMREGPAGGSFWTPGAVAGVALAGGCGGGTSAAAVHD